MLDSASTLDGKFVGETSSSEVDLYLDRCQVDTPAALVEQTWQLISKRRSNLGLVIDFGAGDGRFAHHGSYQEYVGYEIDSGRYAAACLPSNARMINACAFSAPPSQASLACGNPPFVRNQDLPEGWSESAASVVFDRTGVRISGLANAWQYFFFLSLASTAPDGLVALVIPYEWVSRPSSASLRQYIQTSGWDVSVYRLDDRTFPSVLTTSSITIVDKQGTGKWRYFKQTGDNQFYEMTSPSGEHAVLAYKSASCDVKVKRGLSPGTQRYLTLTEEERRAHRLKQGRDVVPCVTSLKPTSGELLRLTPARFERDYVHAGEKCWLVRTDKAPSAVLNSYLESVPLDGRQTSLPSMAPGTEVPTHH